MEVKAYTKYSRITPRKTRLVVDTIRGKDVTLAQNTLSFMPKKAAGIVLKLLMSAVANAEHNFSLQKSNLFVKSIIVGDGPTLKRWMPRAFGRATPIRKRTSHITIVLDEKIPSATKGTSRAVKKVTAASQTISASKTYANEEPVEALPQSPVPSTTEDASPEPFDVRSKGKHRNKQNQDGKNQKPQGFLKKVFRRKAGE